MDCPRCRRPALDARLILDAGDAVKTLVLLDCRTTRTKKSLYSRVCKGRKNPPKLPPIPTLSAPGHRLRFRHCDLADHASPFTAAEREFILAYDLAVQTEKERTFLAAKADAVAKRAMLLADATRLRVELRKALADAPDAEADDLRTIFRTLTREHARITRLVDDAKGTISGYLKGIRADAARQGGTDEEWFLAAKRAFAKESR